MKYCIETYSCNKNNFTEDFNGIPFIEIFFYKYDRSDLEKGGNQNDYDKKVLLHIKKPFFISADKEGVCKDRII